jgi:uncharacterized damage-inducible protein DinB
VAIEGAASALFFLARVIAQRRRVDPLQSSGFHGAPEMVTPDYCRLMARYNSWMNERVYALCAAMTDAERKRDRGAFFASIHGTLNHLLWADRMWLGRFAGPPCTHPQFGADMFADFEELREERGSTDRVMLEWADGVSPEWLAAALVYTSVVDRRTRRLHAAIAAVHMFNHGTHHRGQLTTLLKQAGVDPGVIDLPWVPGVVEVID